MEMLFSNFLANAIDAIEPELDDNEEGIVQVVYESDDEFHKFFVYDSGIEIEKKKDLFEAFKSTKVKGNGLGLVLSRQIAEAHGGSVSLIDGDKKGFEIKLSIQHECGIFLALKINNIQIKVYLRGPYYGMCK